jgi:hypothetical protein
MGKLPDCNTVDQEINTVGWRRLAAGGGRGLIFGICPRRGECCHTWAQNAVSRLRGGAPRGDEGAAGMVGRIAVGRAALGRAAVGRVAVGKVAVVGRIAVCCR